MENKSLFSLPPVDEEEIQMLNSLLDMCTGDDEEGTFAPPPPPTSSSPPPPQVDDGVQQVEWDVGETQMDLQLQNMGQGSTPFFIPANKEDVNGELPGTSKKRARKQNLSTTREEEEVAKNEDMEINIKSPPPPSSRGKRAGGFLYTLDPTDPKWTDAERKGILKAIKSWRHHQLVGRKAALFDILMKDPVVRAKYHQLLREEEG